MAKKYVSAETRTKISKALTAAWKRRKASLDAPQETHGPVVMEIPLEVMDRVNAHTQETQQHLSEDSLKRLGKIITAVWQTLEEQQWTK